MKKSQRFATIAELAKNKEQAAAIALGQSNRIHAENKNKLQSLKQYRLEYLEKFSQDGQVGMHVNTMHTYKTFIEGIDKAIAELKIRILESEQQCLQSKKIWQHVHSKTEIMNTTVDRYKKQELNEDNRREQKETDDRPHRQRVSTD